MIAPVRAEPLDIFLNRIYELHTLFCRVRIIKTHVEFPIVFLCETIIQKD